MKTFYNYKVFATILMVVIFGFTPIMVCASESTTTQSEIIVSGIATFGQPIMVESGTTYYASADFGGSGRHGIIGNEYTTGELFIGGYGFLDENNRLIDYQYSLRDTILAYTETERPSFHYDSNSISSLWIGLYVEGCTNGSVGWVPATSTSLWADLCAELEAATTLEPELELEPDSKLESETETTVLPEPTPSAVQTDFEEPALNSPPVVINPGQSAQSGSSFWFELWQFFRSICKILGLAILFCLAGAAIVVIVYFLAAHFGPRRKVLIYLVTIISSIFEVILNGIIAIVYDIMFFFDAILMAIFERDDIPNSAGSRRAKLYSQCEKCNTAKEKFRLASCRVHDAIIAGPSAIHSLHSRKVAVVLEASRFVALKKTQISAYVKELGFVGYMIMFTDQSQVIKTSDEYLQKTISMGGACLYQTLNTLPEQSFNQVIMVVSGQDTSKMRGLRPRHNIKTVSIVSVNDSDEECFEDLALEIVRKWGIVPTITELPEI